TVVLAEDDPFAQQAITTYLSRAADIELVGIASDGEAALTLVHDMNPDVVIADIHMPKVSGIELTAKLAAALPAIRVLIFTALGDDQVMREALTAGASGFLLKSDSPGLILHGVRSAYRGDALVSPRLVASLLAERRARSDPPPDLTESERHLVGLVGRGLSNAEIAEAVCLAPSTVRTYVSRLLGRFQLANRTALAARAHDWGLVDGTA
ncbi:MAG: response regulator transcription factor, partial [Propionibacteriaceae bacterium]|nr:response regulator transcription factor [Propionibacteriaceae bacterium]